ncbi:hypothetical protein BGX24_006758, partial [Mortierella sp. AD032]
QQQQHQQHQQQQQFLAHQMQQQRQQQQGGHGSLQGVPPSTNSHAVGVVADSHTPSHHADHSSSQGSASFSGGEKESPMEDANT